MIKKFIAAAIALVGLSGSAHAFNRYNNVQISTSVTISPPLQTGNVNFSSGTIGPMTINSQLSLSTPLLLPNGLISAPALAFSNDTNSGLYRVLSHDIELVVNGGANFEMDGTNNYSYLPLNMGPSVNHKIINMANGVAAQDAATMQNIQFNEVNVHKALDCGISSTTFASCGFSVTLTPQFANSSVRVEAYGTYYSTNTTSTCAMTITNTTSSTQLGGTFGLAVANLPTSAAAIGFDIPMGMAAIDTPNSTSPQTYFVQIRAGGANQECHWGDAYGYLIATELVHP